jgi:hypothetical protein
MSTNSSIIVMHPVSGVFASVYVHSDGYLQYNGVLLHRCYTTLEQVAALVSLGDISSLGDSYATTLSYYRGRSDPVRINISPVLSDHDEYEYNYLFRDNEWHVKYHGNAWKPLGEQVSGMGMPRVSTIEDRWDGKTRFHPYRRMDMLDDWSTI